MDESPLSKLERFHSLSQREMKQYLIQTKEEWSKDCIEMPISDILEKWKFLSTIEGLFLAYKILKNFDHLVKRYKRITSNINCTISIYLVCNFYLKAQAMLNN